MILRALLSLSLLLATSLPAGAQMAGSDAVDDLKAAVVGVRAHIPLSARTAGILGTRREGSGVVIDREGHVLTIGYLILEADRAWVQPRNGPEVPATPVAYDHATGFGLLRARDPLEVAPMPLGRSAGLSEDDPVVVLAHDGEDAMSPAVVVSRRPFAGYWEYLLEQAIFTAPPAEQFSGAALVDRSFRLVGLGSLFVRDATEGEEGRSGNVFVPVDLLKPILADLKRQGHRSGPRRPWLGVNVAERFGRVIIVRISEDSPAARAGLKAGDIILAVAGEPVDTMAGFYRALWGLGEAGVTARLRLLQGNAVHELSVVTADRSRHYNVPQMQ